MPCLEGDLFLVQTWSWSPESYRHKCHVFRPGCIVQLRHMLPPTHTCRSHSLAPATARSAAPSHTLRLTTPATPRNTYNIASSRLIIPAALIAIPAKPVVRPHILAQAVIASNSTSPIVVKSRLRRPPVRIIRLVRLPHL